MIFPEAGNGEFNFSRKSGTSEDPAFNGCTEEISNAAELINMDAPITILNQWCLILSFINYPTPTRLAFRFRPCVYRI